MSNGDVIRAQFDNGLYHYGVLGMKWGHRKAQRENKKVDESFKRWKENESKKEKAIELGKKNNDTRIAYENNKSNKTLKNAYTKSNKEYKKVLRENTSWHKGSIRQEVGRDAARKYLSNAKKVKKQLDLDPSNTKLKKNMIILLIVMM